MAFILVALLWGAFAASVVTWLVLLPFRLVVSAMEVAGRKERARRIAAWFVAAGHRSIGGAVLGLAVTGLLAFGPGSLWNGPPGTLSLIGRILMVFAGGYFAVRTWRHCWRSFEPGQPLDDARLEHTDHGRGRVDRTGGWLRSVLRVLLLLFAIGGGGVAGGFLGFLSYSVLRDVIPHDRSEAGGFGLEMAFTLAVIGAVLGMIYGGVFLRLSSRRARAAVPQGGDAAPSPGRQSLPR